MSKRLISICIVGILLCSIYKYAQSEERLCIEEPALDTAAPMEEPFGTEIITGMIILETMNNALSFAAESTSMSESVPGQQHETDDESYNNETVNALGMTLKDDTALLVKVWNDTSPAYNHVCEEYEYDREDRVLRHIKYYSNTKGRWEYEYDAAGSLTREICYELEDDAVRYWIEYRAANGDLVDGLLRIASEYEGDGNLVSETAYNGEGNEVKKTYYRRDGTVYWVIENEYDAAGNLIREVDYGREGKIEYELEYVYDENGNLLQNIHNGSIITENEYNAAGNMFRSVHYDHEGDIEDEWEYTYDEDGHLLKRIHNGSITREYEYDSAGNMTKEITDPYTRWKKYEYDNENRLIKETVQDEDRYEYRYEYKVIDVEE